VTFLNSLQATQTKYWQLNGNDPDRFDQLYAASLDRIIREYGGAFAGVFEKHGLQASPASEVPDAKAPYGDV
jgi:hypothetical protein